MKKPKLENKKRKTPTKWGGKERRDREREAEKKVRGVIGRKESGEQKGQG